MKQMPSDHNLFMQAAREAATRSNCIRRGVGAVIVRNGEVLSSGWNGVSDSYSSCREAGCPRCIEGGTTGTGYEQCICLHAEQMAIGDAAARGVCTRNSTLYVNLRPCLQCLGILKAAGVRSIFFDEDWNYSGQFEPIYQEQAAEFDFFGRLPADKDAASPIRRIA